MGKVCPFGHLIGEDVTVGEQGIERSVVGAVEENLKEVTQMVTPAVALL